MNSKKYRVLQTIIKCFLVIGILVCVCGQWLMVKNVPVFLYHCVLETPYGKNTDLFVLPSEFEAQVKYWSENGYTGIFASELPISKKFEKPIVITFDDGYSDNYEVAYPILKKYNMKATIFVSTKTVGRDGHVTRSQLKEMSNSGLISIQSHSVHHLDLSKLEEEKMKTELYKSKQLLEKAIGSEVTAFAYPYGAYNDAVINEAEKYYETAFITSDTISLSKNGDMEISRSIVYRSTTFEEVVQATREQSKSRLEIIIRNLKYKLANKFINNENKKMGCNMPIFLFSLFFMKYTIAN